MIEEENLEEESGLTDEEMLAKSHDNRIFNNGRPPYNENKERLEANRIVVAQLTACGITQEQIAKKLGIAIETLRKYHHSDYEDGKIDALTKLGGVLFKKALKGDNFCLSMYLKTQGGSQWREVADPDEKANTLIIYGGIQRPNDNT